jgi:hypothetical protein
MKALALLFLLAGSALAATVNVYVYGSRNVQGVHRSFDGHGNLTGVTTSYNYHVSVQIPYRPNGTYVGWERETNVVLATRPTWTQVSNATVRLVRSELQAAGIATNHTYVVRRGGRVKQ